MNYKELKLSFVYKTIAMVSVLSLAVAGFVNTALAHEGHTGDNHEATTGTITVNKVIVGETDKVVGSFSFTVNGGVALSFNPSATNQGSKTVGVVIAEAPFTIREVEENGEGYVTIYNNCDNIVAGETCTITNTFEVVEDGIDVINFELDADDSSGDIELPVVEIETSATDTDNVLEEVIVKVDGDESEEGSEEDSHEEVAYQCEIEGHKYDQDGNPLADWVIGLMKTVTQGDKQDVFDLDEDITDADGYYCLNWDGEAREYRGEGEPTITDGEFSFIYSVYERIVEGWKYLSIEKGPDHHTLEVVPESDVYYGDGFVSTQIGEENGYVYSNAAYHVDFYNELIEEEDDNDNDEEEVVENDRDGRSSGTRVGDRNRSSSTRTDRNKSEETLPAPEPTPTVAGEQVSVIPTGAPGAGVGTGSALTIEQMLFTSERLQLIK